MVATRTRRAGTASALPFPASLFTTRSGHAAVLGLQKEGHRWNSRNKTAQTLRGARGANVDLDRDIRVIEARRETCVRRYPFDSSSGSDEHPLT
jgi:hypothetical protein